ncbi:MAG TPA: T9SS type A sorting domain-containing protein [Chitinophagaceae bacterium]|nr:T9SS type A sorting domain-containing protein [Chitinophagaceae bacterium]
MKNIFTLSFFLLASCRLFALDPAHFTINRISAPYFIVDGNSPATITKAYVGFEVINNSNSAVTYSGLKFTITSIGTSVAGQNYAVVSPASGIMNVGTLAPGQSKVCYFFVSYPAQVAPQATFNISLSDNTAGVKTQAMVIRNRSSISANAGGTATQTFVNQDLIGGIITDDVTYVVGNVQNGDENDLQVSVAAQFDPTKMTLLSTRVISSNVPGIAAGTTDSLYFISGNGSNGATVTVRWTFRISGFNFTSYILPCAGATSGATNYKYALNTSLGAGTPVTVSASANPLTITKTSDHNYYSPGTTANFTVQITNPGLYGITIDKIVDQLPTGFVFQSINATSDVTTLNSTTTPISGATGTMTFEGGVANGSNTSYYIPNGGSIYLRYRATTALSPAFNLLTSVRDYVGSTEVGVASNTVSVTATLPVTLLSFNAALINGVAHVTWATSDEINTQRFEIERNSGNGFIKIGQVNASGGSLVNTHYLFIDSMVRPGQNQYRLKAIDNDGQYHYGKIVSIDQSKLRIRVEGVSPNPFAANSVLRIYAMNNESIELQLTDLSGRVLLQEKRQCTSGNNVIELDKINHLPASTYFLQVKYEGGRYMQKIVRF